MITPEVQAILLQTLLAGIRQFEKDLTSTDPNDLCWENAVKIVLLLPENHDKTFMDYPMPELPDEETWLTNCKNYYQRLKRCPNSRPE